MLYNHITLERHDHTAAQTERLQNAKLWVLRLNADGPPKPFSTATRICRRTETMPDNARCSPGGNRTNCDTDTSTTSTESTTKSAIRRRRKLRPQSRSRDWMAVLQSHGESRRQHLHLHLQLRSGRLHNGRRVGARGNPHHLRNGGDFGFLERIPENRRSV